MCRDPFCTVNKIILGGHIFIFLKKAFKKKKAFSLWKAFRPNLVKSTREMKVPVLKCYLYFSVNLLASKSPHLLGLWQKDI